MIMGGVLNTLNPELLQIDQEERIAALCKEFERRERLALAGYVPPAARARATLAAWLLRLAVLLDRRIASRVEPAAPGLGIRTA
jgi:hypothetical protein